MTREDATAVTREAISGIPDIPLLDRSILSPLTPHPLPLTTHLSPLFIVGSHVKKTTRQLDTHTTCFIFLFLRD